MKWKNEPHPPLSTRPAWRRTVESEKPPRRSGGNPCSHPRTRILSWLRSWTPARRKSRTG